MTLGEVIQINKDNIKKNYPYKTINYFDISSVGEGFLNGINEIDTQSVPSRAKRILKNNDTIISTVRPANRSFYYCKNLKENSIASTGFAVLTPIQDYINARYLYYLITDKKFTSYLVNHQKGATYPAFTVDVLSNKKIILPTLPTQKKISDILSAYDDLIANNLKRIKLLEQAAQNIYKEWFVNMRYPGHENTPINQDTGLPEGWERKSFSSVVDVNPKTTIKKGRIAPFVPMKSLSENSMVIAPIEKRPVSGGMKFKNGDTLFARITPCLENGKTGFVQFMENDSEVASGSTEYIVLRETEEAGRYFIYCTSRERKFRDNAIKSMVGSDGRQRVNPECFDKFDINIASISIRSIFEDSMNTIFCSIQAMVSQNQKLKEARDILLPRLMNQTIEV